MSPEWRAVLGFAKGVIGIVLAPIVFVAAFVALPIYVAWAIGRQVYSSLFEGGSWEP